MINLELTYWVTLSLIPRLWTKRKNEIYVKCYLHQPKISIIQLFEDPSVWTEIGLSEEEQSLFKNAQKELANNSFMIEDLMSQGYNITPLDSPDYPQTLKTNLKQSAPTVIYSKGNLQLLKKPSVAIVGSRNASSISLEFTKNVTQKEVERKSVVVSGYAKGVDRMALDTSVENGGESIIVLPQGITTFSTGYKHYYKYIQNGDVLVMSTFHPKVPWGVDLAMARNAIIYGLANQIFVAQSDEKGGTWSGVIDGLRRNREIFVRKPNKNEKTANYLLIQKGAIPIDMKGNVCPISEEDIEQETDIKNKIEKMLAYGYMSSQDIMKQLKLDWTDNKMKKFLRGMQTLSEMKIKKKIVFCLKNVRQGVLPFSE